MPVTVAISDAERLVELAAVANDEHAQVVLHANHSLRHALRCGAALRQARDLVGRGGWEVWLAENCPSLAVMARAYCRLSYYEAILPEGISPSDALRQHLWGLPSFEGNVWRHPPEIRDEVVRLRREDHLSHREIAQLTGVSKTVVGRWLSDAPEDKRNPARGRRLLADTLAAKRRMKELDHERYRQRVGGSLGRGYGLLRRTIEAVDVARADGVLSVEARQHLSAALLDLYRAEDKLSKAIREA